MSDPIYRGASRRVLSHLLRAAALVAVVAIARQAHGQNADPARQQLRDSLDACRAQHVAATHVTSTNTFPAHVQAQEALLHDAETCAPPRKWSECMNSLAEGALSGDSVRAQADQDALGRLYAEVGASPGAPACTFLMDIDKTGTIWCHGSGFDDAGERRACIDRLNQNIQALRCDQELFPHVWDNVDARNSRGLQKRHDDDCQAQYDAALARLHQEDTRKKSAAVLANPIDQAPGQGNPGSRAEQDRGDKDAASRGPEHGNALTSRLDAIQHADERRQESVSGLASAEAAAGSVDFGMGALNGLLSLGFGIAGVAGYGGNASEAIGLDLMVRQLLNFGCNYDGCTAVELRADGLGTFVFGGDLSFIGLRYGGRATLWYKSYGIFGAIDETMIVNGSYKDQNFSSSYLRVSPGLCTNLGQQEKNYADLVCVAPAFPIDNWRAGMMAEGRFGIGAFDFELQGWYTPANDTGDATARGEDWAILIAFGFRLAW